MNKKGSFHFSVGASSILMIFVVLCLTTFGILSYVTANADSKLSTKNSETVENYYKGIAAGEKMLKQIDEALSSAKLDAAQAAKSGTCAELENYSLYNTGKLDKIEAVLRSGAAKEEKEAACYRYFSAILLSKQKNISVEDAENQPLLISFTTETDGQQLQTKLTANPYGQSQRYQITSRKRILTLSVESESDESIDLWKGK